MTREILYRSFDFLVTRESGVVIVEQRTLGAIVFGIAACVLALLGGWVRGLLPPAGAMLVHWFCIIMAFCGALLLLSAAYFTLRKRAHRFDPHKGIATLRGRDYLMRELPAPALLETAMGGTRMHTLAAQPAGQEIALMSSTVEGALAPVHQALLEVFAASGATPAVPLDRATGATQDSVTWRRFLAASLLLLGALWASVGYLTMPHVLLAPHGHASGVLLWPLGLWLMALGLLECVFQWRDRSFFGGPPRVVRITLAGCFFSYLLLCWR